jgi:hypothetical protein
MEAQMAKTTIVNTNLNTVSINTDFGPMDMICELLEVHLCDKAPDDLIKMLGAYVTHMKNTNPAKLAHLERTNPLFLSILSGLSYRGEFGDCPWND